MISSKLKEILSENRKWIHKKIFIYGLITASILSIIFYFSPIIAFFILTFLVSYNNLKILENKINAMDYHNECLNKIEEVKNENS